jgi:hypothetical protein
VTAPFGEHVQLRVSQQAYRKWGANTPAWLVVSGHAYAFHEQQFEAASVVTINHNLGRAPMAVTLTTLGGVEFDAAVHHLNLNQLQIHLDSPIAGYCRVV